MAGAVRKSARDSSALTPGNVASAALPQLGTARWLPPLLIALATLLALLAAYSLRPAVNIDIGDYLDRPYLPLTHDRDEAAADFYAPEIGPIGAEQVFDWPVQQTVLEVPGNRSGLWQVTVTAAPGLDAQGLKLYTLSANGVRLWIARSSPRELVLVIPDDIARAPTLQLQLEPGLVGDPMPPAGSVAQVKLAPARSYRWSSGESTIALPGIGRGDWLVRLTAALQHPDGQPLNATISANGTVVANLPDGDRRQIAFLVPAALVPDGDLTLTLRTNTFKDPRNLGVLLYDVNVAPAGNTPLLPPLKFALYALIIALCLYLCLLRMTSSAALAALVALVVMLGGTAALAWMRFPTTFVLPRLAVLALWSVLLLLVLERLIAWAFARAGVPLSSWVLRALLLIFFVGYWVKAGAMLTPYFVGIDMSLQLQWARRIFSGEFWSFYGTNNPMNERTMPVAEWGTSKPVIPYSPWFHIFAGLFLLLPMPAVLGGHMFSALVDCSRVFLIALLGRKAGLSERESVFASALYAVTPATFLLHSWGNLPTTFGIWWTLLATVFIVAAYRRLDHPGPFVVLTLILTVTMLMYTVMAVFMMVFLALLLPGLWLFEQRSVATPHSFADPIPGARRPIYAIALAALAALVLVTLVYYGQYIPLIIERTLPYFFDGNTGQKAGIQNHQPFLEYLADYIPRLGYDSRSVAFGLWVPLLLAFVGMLRLPNRRFLVLALSWLGVTLLFTIAGSRIAMVDKQVFYYIPMMMLLTAPVLEWAWRRGLAGRLAVGALYIGTFGSALALWFERVVTIRQ